MHMHAHMHAMHTHPQRESHSPPSLTLTMAPPDWVAFAGARKGVKVLRYTVFWRQGTEIVMLQWATRPELNEGREPRKSELREQPCPPFVSYALFVQASFLRCLRTCQCDQCGGGTTNLATSVGTYTVTICTRRVLARCGGLPPPPCATLPAVAGMAVAYSHDAAASPRTDNNIATYSCTAAGYVSSGDGTSTCLADGSWDTTPACIVRLQLAKL